MESNQLELDMNPFRAVEVIHTPLRMFASEAEAKNIHLSKDIHIDPSLMVVGDSHKVID